MVIESDKPLINCQFCGKSFRNIGSHIITNHPSVLNGIVENPSNSPQQAVYTAPNSTNPPMNRAVLGDLNGLIREKLETMLNIKIIEMLSHGENIGDIQNMINPPKTSITLDDIKKYHDLFYKESMISADQEDGSKWLDLAVNALPIIKEMLPQKQQEVKNVEHGEYKSGDLRVYKPISLKDPRDPRESSDLSRESSDLATTKQPDHESVRNLDHRD